MKPVFPPFLTKYRRRLAMNGNEMNILQDQLIPPKKKAKNPLRFREELAGYLFIAPNILGFLVFSLVPIFATIYIAFCDWDLINPIKWIGLTNFSTLFSAPDFWASLRQTVLFTMINVPVQSLLALGIALILNQKLKGLNIFRTLFLIPWVCMPIAHALTWQWLYSFTFGYLNHVLTTIGLPAVHWLNDPNIAFCSVIFVNV
jgi:multiple sugar transport system permease protein